MYRDSAPFQRRGSLQLWQFLVTLLDDPTNGHFITWTGRGMEFKLIDPEEVSLIFHPEIYLAWAPLVFVEQKTCNVLFVCSL